MTGVTYLTHYCDGRMVLHTDRTLRAFPVIEDDCDASLGDTSRASLVNEVGLVLCPHLRPLFSATAVR